MLNKSPNHYKNHSFAHEDKLHDKCGVFGIYSEKADVARITYYALYGIQHRGQESAGIAVSNGKRFLLKRGMGLVRDVFKTEKHIERLGKGIIAVGHNRYSTTGSSVICNAQPFLLKENERQIVIAHNGNLINSISLKKEIKRIKLTSTTDTEIVAAILLESEKNTWEERFDEVLPKLKGAYSFVIATRDLLFGIRDPFGVRPLMLGKIDNGWVLSSEDCIFPGIGAKLIREVRPGEAVIIDKNGPKSFYQQKVTKKASCIFEYVYLARPDSTFNKVSIGQSRTKCGELLAHEAPTKADMVMAVPDSGTAAAIGFAKESGIPFGEGVIQNRYIGRTFIQPDKHTRELGIKIKFGPMQSNLKGKRIVVIDDSMVRGTTLRDFVKLLKTYGAKEVHVRIASPAITSPCFYGVDMPTKEELIANYFNNKNGVSVKKIQKFLGANSFAYLSLKGLLKATESKYLDYQKSEFCTACFSGTYKISITDSVGKFNLESNEKIENNLKKIAVLISDTGTGTNLQAIIDGVENKKINGKIVVVISDTEKALGLEKAKKHNLNIEICEKKEMLLEVLRKYNLDYIALAGWRQIVTDDVIKSFKNKILNLHPGIIPKTLKGISKNPDGTHALWNRGKLTDKAIENVFKNETTYAGSSLFLLSRKFDFGKVLKRCFEKVTPNDTIETLYSRLKKKENEMYVIVLQELCK